MALISYSRWFIFIGYKWNLAEGFFEFEEKTIT